MNDEELDAVSEELYRKILEYRAPIVQRAMMELMMYGEVNIQKLLDEADERALNDYKKEKGND